LHQNIYFKIKITQEQHIEYKLIWACFIAEWWHLSNFIRKRFGEFQESPCYSSGKGFRFSEPPVCPSHNPIEALSHHIRCLIRRRVIRGLKVMDRAPGLNEFDGWFCLNPDENGPAFW